MTSGISLHTLNNIVMEVDKSFSGLNDLAGRNRPKNNVMQYNRALELQSPARYTYRPWGGSCCQVIDSISALHQAWNQPQPSLVASLLVCHGNPVNHHRLPECPQKLLTNPWSKVIDAWLEAASLVRQYLRAKKQVWEDRKTGSSKRSRNWAKKIYAKARKAWRMARLLWREAEKEAIRKSIGDSGAVKAAWEARQKAIEERIKWVEEEVSQCGRAGGVGKTKCCEKKGVIPHHCKKIHACEYCARQFKHKYSKRVMAMVEVCRRAGKRVVFITLTLKDQGLENIERIKEAFTAFLSLRVGTVEKVWQQSIAEYEKQEGAMPEKVERQRRCWEQFKKWLESVWLADEEGRHGRGPKFRDVFVKGMVRIEIKLSKGKDGRYHVHLHLVAGVHAPIPQILLAALWERASGDSRVCWITAVKGNGKRVANYVAKYITKAEGEELSHEKALEVDAYLWGDQQIWSFGSLKVDVAAEIRRLEEAGVLRKQKCPCCGHERPELEYLHTVEREDDGQRPRNVPGVVLKVREYPWQEMGIFSFCEAYYRITESKSWFHLVERVEKKLESLDEEEEDDS